MALPAASDLRGPDRQVIRVRGDRRDQPPNIGLVRSLGADHVVDYTTTDFARSGRRYDLILDTVGNRSVPDLRRALAGGGKAAVTGFTSAAMLIRVSLRGGAGPGGRWS